MEESLSTNNLENTDSISNAIESQLILFPNSSSNEPLQEEIEEDDILEEIDPVQAILPEIELELADPTEKLGHPKKKYCKISNEKRLELIDSVENRGQKIKDVANRLSINYSSAKSICQVFKREGRKDKKAFKNRIINEKQENPQSDLMLQNAPSSADSHYPAPQSQKIETENPEQGPEKDSLMELRDRLLKSRLGKREEFDDGQGALTHEKQTQTSDNSNNNNYYNSYNNEYANMQQQQHQYEQNAMNQQRQMYQQLGQQNFMNNSNNQGFQQSGSMQTEQNKGNQTNMGDNNNNNMNRYQPQQVYMHNQMPQQQHFIMVTSQPQHQSNLQGYIYQQNQSNSGQYSNNNNNSGNNNTGQSNSNNTSTNVQNFYINDSNTTTFYPSQNFQMNQGYQVLNQGQGQGQGQGQYYITSNSDTNNGQQQGYQMVQPMMMMIPMNQSMQQGYFVQPSDNNYNQQQNSYMLVRGNQNQNQNQNQIQGNMQNQSVKDSNNEGRGQVSSDNIEKK